MKSQKSSFQNVVLVGIVSGLISIVIVNFTLSFFTSGWLFCIIPLIVCWSIKKFATINKNELTDDETFEKISKKTGFLCAGIVTLEIILALLPSIIIFGTQFLITLLTDFGFYIVCAISVYWGYIKGVEAITDVYYDMLLSEENDNN